MKNKVFFIPPTNSPFQIITRELISFLMKNMTNTTLKMTMVFTITLLSLMVLPAPYAMAFQWKIWNEENASKKTLDPWDDLALINGKALEELHHNQFIKRIACFRYDNQVENGNQKQMDLYQSHQLEKNSDLDYDELEQAYLDYQKSILLKEWK